MEQKRFRLNHQFDMVDVYVHGDEILKIEPLSLISGTKPMRDKLNSFKGSSWHHFKRIVAEKIGWKSWIELDFIN